MGIGSQKQAESAYHDPTGTRNPATSVLPPELTLAPAKEWKPTSDEQHEKGKGSATGVRTYTESVMIASRKPVASFAPPISLTVPVQEPTQRSDAKYEKKKDGKNEKK